MPRLGTFATYWLPVLLWMALIFTASTDAFSASRTSRFIGPFLRWFHPAISDHAIRQVQYAVRKTGHVVEYALLSALLWRAFRQPRRRRPCPWHWPSAGLALAGSILYAITDEWHQGLVPTRDGRLEDVGLDAGGAILGLAVVWACGRWKKRW